MAAEGQKTMKIRDLSQVMSQAPQLGEVERKAEAGRNFMFKSELSNIHERNFLEKLQELGGKINEQGELVKKRMDITELKRYKKMVADFLSEAVKYSFEFKKSGTFDARGRHRVYAVIKKINTRMDELTQALLKEEKDALAVMEAIDDIRGMLMDIEI